MYRERQLGKKNLFTPFLTRKKGKEGGREDRQYRRIVDVIYMFIACI